MHYLVAALHCPPENANERTNPGADDDADDDGQLLFRHVQRRDKKNVD